MTMRHPDGPRGAEEEAWAARFEKEQELENGYRTQQATRPQTLSYAMMDSPVGVAAWLVEKFNSWSDTVGDDIESVHTKDALLTNIMIYLVTRTFNTASWIYYGRREEGGRAVAGGEESGGADGLRPVPRRAPVVASEELRGKGLQRDALDRDAAGRPLRGDGAAGAVHRGYPGLWPDRSRGGYNAFPTSSAMILTPSSSFPTGT